jgi:hypothetical protein
MQIRRPKALVACSGVPPESNLAVELVEHRFDVRHAKPPGNVLPQRAELARGELIAAHGAPLDQEGLHVLGEGLGDVGRQVKRHGALDGHQAVIHAMDVPAIVVEGGLGAGCSGQPRTPCWCLSPRVPFRAV